MLKAAWILLLMGILLLAPLLATHDPRATDLDVSLADPSQAHLLGADLLGRDIFSRLLYGGRRALVMAGGGTLIAALGGLLLGTFAALESPTARLIFGSLINALLSVPSLLIALVMLSILGKGFGSVVLAIGIAGISPFARTTQDAMLVLRAMPYVESALSIGVPPRRLLTHYLLLNAWPLLLTFAGVTFSWGLLNGAALAFLGFMGDPDAPDWGVMLAAGRQTFAVAPYEALSAGVALTLLIAFINGLVNSSRS
jgi:peptide/nickel transport system permease protein